MPDNVERMRRVLAAYNARDIEELISYCDPGVEFHAATSAIGDVYHGHDGMRSWHRDVQEAFGEGIRLEAQAYFELDDEQTLAFYTQHLRGQHSGVELVAPNALVASWRHGMMVYCRAYAHREDALSDLGMSEDALDPIAP
jgi:hypothetical protein